MADPRPWEDQPLAGLEKLAGLARASLPPPTADPELLSERGYRRCREALDAGSATRGRVLLRRLAVPAVAVLLVVASASSYALLREPLLTYTVESGAPASVRALPTTQAPDGETRMRFSDGTEVRLDPSSRSRVAWTGRKGARIIVDSGQARVKVVPRKGGNWVFNAGPCLIQVTGTQFDMRWSAAQEILEVWLYSGSVIVKAPISSRGIPLGQGQHLYMDVRRASFKVNELPANPAAPSAPLIQPRNEPIAAAESASAADSTQPPEPADSVPPRMPGWRAVRAGEPWTTRVLAGDFDGVLRDAEKRGVEEVLRRGSPIDVMALADAARYAGRMSLAKKALLTVRSRSSGSGQARRAVFLLGRMAEDREGDLAEALEWYRLYLEGPSRGAYEAEALGRQMTATWRFRGVERARPLAEIYLRRYSDGPYAEPARAILKSP